MPDIKYKIWVSIERIDEDNDSYENLVEVDIGEYEIEERAREDFDRLIKVL